MDMDDIIRFATPLAISNDPTVNRPIHDGRLSFTMAVKNYCDAKPEFREALIAASWFRLDWETHELDQSDWDNFKKKIDASPEFQTLERQRRLELDRVDETNCEGCRACHKVAHMPPFVVGMLTYGLPMRNQGEWKND